MIIQVKVRANAGKQLLEKVNDNEYKAYLKKPAEDNKANIELLKLLKKYFKTNAKILKGLRSREKIIEIR